MPDVYAFPGDPPLAIPFGEPFRSPISGQTFGPSWLARATHEKRLAIGLQKVSEPPTVPAGQYETGRQLAMSNGQVVWRRQLASLPLAARKQGLQLQRMKDFEARLEAGYPVVLDGLPETLQVARDRDKLNWLGLLETCKRRISAGQGEEEISPPIRATSNRLHPMSHAAAEDLVLAALSWLSATLAANWTMEAAIDAAADAEALAQIDVNAWPQA